ncbi:MAG: heme NO-binding domain-containing protein [Pseudomonadota bacterium]
MICKALEGYVRTTHGDGIWDQACRDAGIKTRSFETVHEYPDEKFDRVLMSVAGTLGRRIAVLMEDMGMWVVTHPPLAPVRRLFRFSGETFSAFMVSLDEINDRAQMALPGLELPIYRVRSDEPGAYVVRSTWVSEGGGPLLCGVLQALADEYGALVLLEVLSSQRIDGIWHDETQVQVVQEDFQAPSSFQLGQVT